MKQFDKNQDGRITEDEMSAQAFLFGQMDADKNGIVTAEELAAYQQRTQPLQEKPAEPDSPAKTSADVRKREDAGISNGTRITKQP
jgi:Ca2+-binding EF-hand superfamily protein